MKSPHRFNPGKRSHCGFTLVEVLVVISLLSVVMLALGAAFRTFAQTEVRVDRRLNLADEFRVASSFLRKTLSRVSLRKPDSASEAADPNFLFTSDAHSVAWIGVMPARYGTGGLHYFRLAVESIDAKSSLVIRFKPCLNSATFPKWNETEFRVMISDVSSFRILYQDNDRTTRAWSEHWTHTDRLPGAVQFTFQVAGIDWPHVIIPIRVLPSVSDQSDVFVTGAPL
jgi:general secretion pathway protein J